MSTNTKIVSPILMIGMILFTILTSCTNHRQKIIDKIDAKVDSLITRKIEFIVTTMPFLCSSPQDFWYPEQTSAQEILNDDVNTGYEGLSRLDNIVLGINSDYSKEIKIKVDSLHFFIVDTKKAIKKYRDLKNDFFGSIILSYTQMLGSFFSMGNSSGQKEQNASLPKNILKEYESLQSEIVSEHKAISRSALKVERKSIEEDNYPNLSDDDRNQIRNYLIKSIKNRFKSKTGSNIDTLCRNMIIDVFVDLPITGRCKDSLNKKVDNFFLKYKNKFNDFSSHIVKALKNAVIYDLSNDDRIYDDSLKMTFRFGLYMDTLNFFKYDDNTKVFQVEYSYGTLSSLTSLYYCVKNDRVKNLSLIYDEDIYDFITTNKIDDFRYFRLANSESNELNITGSAYKESDANCCPSFIVSFKINIFKDKIFLKQPRIEKEFHNSN